MNVIKLKESGELADYIAGNTALDSELKQEVLETLNADQRLEFLIDILQDEIKILEIENIISSKAKEQMDQNQREYYLREQIRAIYNELGEDESQMCIRDRVYTIATVSSMQRFLRLWIF